MTAFKDRVFVFTGGTFEMALEEWRQEALEAYPQQRERIEITARAMRDFLGSPQIERYRMTLGSQRATGTDPEG